MEQVRISAAEHAVFSKYGIKLNKFVKIIRKM
jgi:hypothetical protein